MVKTEVPPYNEMLWPALKAVAELGGSASISEIVETVVKQEAYSDEQQAVLHNDGPATEIGYRLAWARTYLKGMGLLDGAPPIDLIDGDRLCGLLKQYELGVRTETRTVEVVNPTFFGDI